MLQSQIDYWNLQETKRHNQATEEAGFQQARAAEISANASRLQAEVAQQTLPFKAQEAEAALSQARAALENASTNRGNLDVNRMNAATNARNADVNQQNANTNARNAEINAWNASINEWNASINQQNANTNAYNAQTNRMGTTSQMLLNRRQGAKYDAETALTWEKLPEQENKNVITGVEADYARAEHFVGLIDTGSHAVNNVGSGVGSLLRGAGGLISGVANASNGSSSNTGSSILSKLPEKVVHFTEPSTKYIDPKLAGSVIKSLISLL